MFLLFALSIIDDFLTIDLGSEYYKVAKSTYKGDPVMVNIEGVGTSIPTAISFKSSKPIEYPITNETMDDIEIKFDQQALKLIKKNSSVGFQFIPRLIGRSGTKALNTSNLITPFQAFCLSFINLIRRIEVVGPISVIIPHYWTPEQRFVISATCNLFRIPLNYIFEDSDVIGILYSQTRTNRFRKITTVDKGRNVLFVDIGGTTTKVFGYNFYMDKDTAVASENSYFWSEEIGGYWFRKSISESLNISMKKAEKLLKNEKEVEKVLSNSKNVTDKLFELIKRAAHRANSYSEISNGSAIDEVQLIGGASSYPFINELVKVATNCTNVRKEFNPREALALGGVYLAMQTADSSKYVPSYVYKRPPINITLKCRDENQYCVRGLRCNKVIYEQESKGCDEVILYTDASTTPEGLSNIISRTKLLNLSNIKYDEGENGYGKFTMSSTQLSIEDIEWCKSKSGLSDENVVCYPIQFENHFGNPENARFEALWIFDYWKSMKRREEKSEVLAKINDLVVRLDTFFTKIEKGKVEVAVHVTDQQKDSYKELSAKYYKGGLDLLDFEQINQTYYEIRGLAKSLKMKLDDEKTDEL